MIEPKVIHSWDITEEKAKNLQIEYAQKVITIDNLNDKITLVAGVDVAYKDNSDNLTAAIVLLNVHTLKVVEYVVIEDIVLFPYIPGLFSFREIPPIIKAFSTLKNIPDLIVCDGHGLAHPRRFGLACHLGVLFDLPTIGCGKTNLIEKPTKVRKKRGESENIIDKGEIVGRILWTQDNIRPVYVSIGHRISLSTACKWILNLAPSYRLPETTRLADQAANGNFPPGSSHVHELFHQ